MTFRVTHRYTRPNDSVPFFETISQDAQAVVTEAENDGRIESIDVQSDGNVRTVTLNYRDVDARESVRLAPAVISHTEAGEAHNTENNIAVETVEETV